VNAFLSSWEQGKLPEQKKQDVQGVESTKVITIDRDLTQANIVLGHLGIRRSNPDFYAISVMNYILGGGGFSSRLMEIVRDQQGLAYSIYSAFIPSVQKGVFEAAVQTKNESANTVVREILEQMERIRENQVTDQELSDAIAYLTGSFPRRLDTLSKLSTFMAVVEFYNLGLDYDKKYMGYIKDVSAKDVLRVAQEYLHPDKYVLVVVANQKKAGIDRQSK
jgi:zinc protease